MRMPLSPRCRDLTRSRILSLALVLGSMVGMRSPGSAAEPATHHAVRRLPEQVLVVINADSPISRDVGRDYASKRHVPTVLEVHCPDAAVRTADETMAFAAYQESIEAPIRAVLATHPGIDFIVLTKGIPIRLTGGRMGNTVGDGSQRGVAVPSLDSTLAALGYDAATAEPYTFAAAAAGGATGAAWANRYWNADEPFSHAKFGGYLVSRLDGYTRQDALSLVARALAAEGAPPRGPMLLDVQPEFGIGAEDSHPEALPDHAITRETRWSIFNTDLVIAARRLEGLKVAVELDLTPAFLGERTDLAGYYSWGSNDAHFRPEAYASLRFAPGSISDTAVPTSARTFLPTAGGADADGRSRRPRPDGGQGLLQRAPAAGHLIPEHHPGPLCVRLHHGGELRDGLALRRVGGHRHR